MDPYVIPFSFPGLPKIRCFFGTRVGGVSPAPYDTLNISFDVGDDPQNVRTNRKRLMERLPFSHWQELRQVHGQTMLFDPEPAGEDGMTAGEGDGMGTSRPGRALVIKTADCQPILLAHRGGRHVAALHCGWRGNRADFPGTGVREFCSRYGLDPEDVLAVRGPSLGPDHAQFVNFSSEWGEEFAGYYDPISKTVDLWRLTGDQLRTAGIRPENVFSVDLCTYLRRDIFFSYRRERASGRQASWIWIDAGSASAI
ncbi:MAG: polyphenol oxidase family protein [Desulfovibrionales bacterium]